MQLNPVAFEHAETKRLRSVSSNWEFHIDESVMFILSYMLGKQTELGQSQKIALIRLLINIALVNDLTATFGQQHLQS